MIKRIYPIKKSKDDKYSCNDYLKEKFNPYNISIKKKKQNDNSSIKIGQFFCLSQLMNG